MARLSRLALVGHAHYLLLRGHNRNPIVIDDDDRRQLLNCLHDCVATQKLALHAYALCAHELHLLVTPPATEALSRAVQAFGRRYVTWFNQRHGRSGTLWDGRFRCAPVEPGGGVLTAMRCIESSPVHQGESPVEQIDPPWTSARHHLGHWRDPMVNDLPAYWALGNTPFDREAAYRRWLEDGGSAQERAQLLAAVQRGLPWGSPQYLAELRELTERPLQARPRGRPRKPSSGKLG